MAIQSTYLDAERKRQPLQAGQSSPWLDLLRKKIGKPRLEVLAGCGHFPQLEAAERVNRLISDFAAAGR
jgi:pimeloyl-ACP methyl ester carboxylesterase